MYMIYNIYIVYKECESVSFHKFSTPPKLKKCDFIFASPLSEPH